VGSLNTVKLNQRRFAPTPAHITGIRCPLHWNTQLSENYCRLWLWPFVLLRQMESEP